MTAEENTDVPSSEPHAPVAEADDRLRVREAQFRNVSVEVSVWIGKTRLSFGELSDLQAGPCDRTGPGGRGSRRDRAQP